MARHGFFHTEFVDPLVPEIYRAYATKPPEQKAIFLLSPHGYYVYDLDKGLVYNVFPPGMSILLYPFVKLGGRSAAFFVLPFLILMMIVSFYYWGSKLAGPVFGLCLSVAAVFSGNVFENTIVIMSDVPSMALISLSAFLLYRNIKSPRRIRPFVAGAILFGILPLAVYTDRLFGTVFRLVYEPFNQSRMAWANIGPGISFYLKSLVQSFGIPGLALMAIGLGACMARRRIRSAGFFCPWPSWV